MVGRVAAVGMLVAVLAVAAAGHGAGQAGFAPRLRAELVRSLGTGPSIVLDVSQTTAQPPLARATFVVPRGQSLRLPPPGAIVGDAAVALVPTAGETRAPSLLSGHLVTRAPSPARAEGCVREPTASLEAALRTSTPRAAVRRLTLSFFVHVHRGTTRLTACLPRQDGLSGRAAVRRLVVRLVRGLGAPPAGTSVWRGLFTPVGKRGGAAAYPTTTESRGIVVSPSFLTLQGPASAARGASVPVYGLLSFGELSHGRNVRVTTPAGVVVRTRTRASGAYALRVRATRQRATLVLQARVRSRRVHCSGRTADSPAGCTSATLAGVSSNGLRILVR